ncbi:MAG: hydroxymethylglutaryl-CoA synthase [Dehalococcoidia bacterium]|nr:hydroxymethylglutaryl-CoA synthase [Dehalococcoidia bacterium]
MSGIIGYGVYVPKYRIKQQDIGIPWGSFGMGEKAVCGWDEDIISMAAEALDNAMKNAGVKGGDIGALYMGTASSHMVETHLSPILAELHGISPHATVLDLPGTLNAVGNALSTCMMAIEAKTIDCGIVVGTENRMVGPGSDGEVSFGAAAVAMVVGTKNTIADIEGVASYRTLFLDRWRNVKDPWVSNLFDQRFFRDDGYAKHIQEATNALLAKINKKTADFKMAIFPQVDARVPAGAGKVLGIKNLFPDLTGVIGDVGGVSPFLCLTGALDQAKPGDRFLVASYGSGMATAFSIVAKEGIEKSRGKTKNLEKYIARKSYVDYPAYLRLMGNLRRVPY